METIALNITTYLQSIIDHRHNTIEREIALWLIEEDAPLDSLKTLLKHGCIGRTVPSMIYYTDIQKFFYKYYRQINHIYQTSPLSVPKDGNVIR